MSAVHQSHYLRHWTMREILTTTCLKLRCQAMIVSEDKIVENHWLWFQACANTGAK